MKPWTRAAMVAGACALVLGGLTAPAVAHDNDSETVTVEDRCDPATFNAEFDDPTFCVAHEDGDVEFAELIDAIAEDPAEAWDDQDVSGWRFDDDDVDLDAGEGLVVTNTGGEAHSFTPVARFGLGCVPPLNDFFAGLGLADACVGTPENGFNNTLILPGQTLTTMVLSPGRYRFECMIHPWMQTEVTVET